jgi:integrase
LIFKLFSENVSRNHLKPTMNPTQPALLSLTDQMLVRALLKGIPLSALKDETEAPVSAAYIAELRARLFLKATRLQAPWASLWLDFALAQRDEKRSLDRLSWLLQQPDSLPCPTHPLTYWLRCEWVEKLTPLQCATCQDFVDFYASSDKQWWLSVAGLGAVHAKAIENTLQALFPSAFDRTPAKHPPLPVLYDAGVAPLERLLLPVTLDGSQGANRAKTEAAIPATQDFEAMQCWLSRFDAKSLTLLRYRREVERLLLWAIVERGKPLSSLDSVDIADYRRFLRVPQPTSRWIGPPCQRSDPRWKPFNGPLSEKTVLLTDTILKGFFSYLVELDYLRHNPFAPLPKLKNPAGQGALEVNRSFTEKQWQRLEQVSLTLIQNTHRLDDQRKWQRAWMIVYFGLSTGLRLHEMVKVKIGDIQKVERDDNHQYWMNVLGKGNKLRRVPIPTQAYQQVNALYQMLTGHSIHLAAKSYPLIPSLRKAPDAFLKPLAIHKTLKGFFEQVVTLLSENDAELVEKLERASAHWLRHTYGSIAADKAIPLAMIKESLGHSSLATTSQYVHADDDARHKAFNKTF